MNTWNSSNKYISIKKKLSQANCIQVRPFARYCIEGQSVFLTIKWPHLHLSNEYYVKYINNCHSIQWMVESKQYCSFLQWTLQNYIMYLLNKIIIVPFVIYEANSIVWFMIKHVQYRHIVWGVWSLYWSVCVWHCETKIESYVFKV